METPTLPIPPIGREPASLTAFMNALWREWPAAHYAAADQVPRSGPAGALRLPLTRPAGALIAPLAHVSPAGRHRFVGDVHFVPAQGLPFEVDFAQAAALLAGEPTLGTGARAETRRLFLRRVLDSASTLKAAETARQDALAQLTWPQADYIAAEQGLVHGHAVHPTPKSRDEFTPSDLLRYSPEFGGRAPLSWFALKDEALWRTDAGAAPALEQLQALIDSDAAVRDALHVHPREDGWHWLPVHSWQAGVLRQTAAYRHWRARGSLVDLGELGEDWYATSSLRTVYAPHAPHMLKFSLSVRLTNSKRVLQPAEVARGRLIYGAFHSRMGQDLLRRCPNLGVMHETAALALRDPSGEPIAESFVIFRDNPFPAGSTDYVMATLSQDGVDGGLSMAARSIAALAARERRPLREVALTWFDRFVEHALTPLLIAQADYGFLFSAHAQNTVLTLRDGWPAGIWFRDCQGTTFRAETIAALAAEVPGIERASELSFDEATSNHLLGYYLIVNNVLTLVAALGADGVADEAALCALMRERLRALRRLPLRYPHFIDYLLASPDLMSKGNFMICFTNLNETTEPEGSFRSYVPIENPIVQLEAARALRVSA